MYRYVLKLMFLLPPERIHHLAFLAMQLVTRFAPLRVLVSKILVVDDPVLHNTVFGVPFRAPLGLAAGFDKDATGADIHYLMLRGIFGPPDMPKEATDWYIALLKKVSETPEWKKYLDDGALKPAFATGDEYVKWLEGAEQLHRELMAKGGLLKK